jgi:hypothetical protein
MQKLRPDRNSVLAGVSLEDAYVALLRAKFSRADEMSTGSTALYLKDEAVEAYKRLGDCGGVIDRTPELVCAHDDWDSVAMRLVAAGSLSIDQARDDILVHRHWATPSKIRYGPLASS